jgi:hypothetical protein
VDLPNKVVNQNELRSRNQQQQQQQHQQQWQQLQQQKTVMEVIKNCCHLQLRQDRPNNNHNNHSKSRNIHVIDPIHQEETRMSPQDVALLPLEAPRLLQRH